MMPLMWISLLLAHLFSNTSYNVILRHAAAGKKIDPIFLAAITSTAVAAPAAVGIFVANINWSLFNTRMLSFYAVFIVTITVFHILNAKALGNTEASIFPFLYNFRIGFVTLFGIWFLSESVVPLRMAGGAFVFIAGFILVGKATATSTGVAYSISSAVTMAIVNALEKYLITQLGFAGYAFPSMLITAGLLWLMVIIGKRHIDKDFIATRECFALMVARCLSAYGFTLSLSVGALVSVATYVSALNCVTTPIAAVIFLKETSSLKKKILAGVVALAGVTLIFLAAR